MITNEALVKQLLEEKPITRKDDFILYGFVLKHYGIDLNMTLGKFLQSHNKLGVPSFKSIERARRTIQAENPELVDFTTYSFRMEEEEKYKEHFGRKK